MSDLLGDLGSIYSTSSLTGASTSSTSSSSNSSLDMTDFLQLMVAQFENQSIDDTADTTDMLNQLVQMQMIEAITSITEATEMMYAGSMVGKEVTIGQYDSSGTLQTRTGTVTGAGTSNGEQIVFVDDMAYSLSDIMAIGKLPGSSASTSVVSQSTTNSDGTTKVTETT
jgi:flagellar basal-body rod modification protein FlgD